MSGVGPVANHTVASSKRISLRAILKTTALAAFGSILALAQPLETGHLDAAHLLGLDGPGSDRWRTFLMASPAGSTHQSTYFMSEARGTSLASTGIGRLGEDGLTQTALAPTTQADELITGSVRSSRLPAGQDPNIVRDTRQHLTISPAVHALRQTRRAPVSMHDAHPFERLELASLPTDGFGGYVGMIAPPPDMMFAEAIDGAEEGYLPYEAPAPRAPSGEVSPFMTAMVDPSASTSALESTAGQQQISAFLGNDRQFQCLAEGIYFEARGEPRPGQVAVAQVIMNRVNHDEFPDTICGVVYQNQHWRNRCQFSFACDGVPERITERTAWAMAEDVTRQVLEGRDLIQTITESTHYHANYVRPRWAPRMIRLDRIGLHIFYKGRYGGWR